MKIIDKLAWIHIVDRKVLITRSAGKDTYYIPGGKREEGESDIEALVREIQEELSVNLVTDQQEFIKTFEAQAHGKAEGMIVKMTCYSGPYTGEIHPASEIEEIAWFTYADKAKSSPVDNLIFDWLKSKNLID